MTLPSDAADLPDIAAYELLDLPIALVDAQGRLQALNTAFTRFTGFADPATWCALVQDPAQPCIAKTLDYDLGGPVPILDDPNVTYDLRLKDCTFENVERPSVVKNVSGLVLDNVKVNGSVVDKLG